MEPGQQVAMAAGTAYRVAEHVHVEALARHQLAQESNLAQAAVDTLKAWRRRSGK